jgi:hypothetical protein
MYFSYLHNGNNHRRSDTSLHDWPHNDKTDLRLYLLGTNHNLKKKQNIEAKRRKLQRFYNIQNNNSPRYLCDLIPPTIQSTTVYPLRINPSLRNVESIAKFKSELRKQKDIRQVPKHYEIGPRTLNIALTQLRCL